MGRKKGTELVVFKGREAKLNYAIFQILALKGQQTIYDVYKQVIKYKGLKNTRYASVNKRIKALEEKSYIKRTGTRLTCTGWIKIL
jgi:hypothetical protein